MGFTLPWKHWLKNELRTFCENYINALANRNYFNKQAVLNLWKNFLNDDKKTTWSRVWYLIVLEHWLQKNGVE